MWRDMLSRHSKNICGIAIDEAHCMATWYVMLQYNYLKQLLVKHNSSIDFITVKYFICLLLYVTIVT